MDTLIFIGIFSLLIFGLIDTKKALYFVVLAICTLILVVLMGSYSHQVLIFTTILYITSCVVYIIRKWSKSKSETRCSRDYEELRKEADLLMENNLTLRRELETCEESSIRLESYKKQLEAEIDNLNSIREHNEVLKKKLDECKSYKDNLESKQVSSDDIETVRNQYTEAMKLCQSLTEELSTAVIERDTFESQLFDYEDLVYENSMLRVQIFNLKSKIDELLISLTHYKSKNMGVSTNEDVKKLVGIYKIVIYELERRLSEYDEDKKYKDMYINSNTEREQLEVQLEDCMLQVQEMQEQYNTLLGTMGDQSNTIKDLEASIKERDTTIEDLSKTIESLNMELKLLKRWR